MSRLFRVSLIALALCVCATGALANIPDPELSDVPGAIVMSPGARFARNPIGGYTVHIEGQVGPVNGALVEVEVSPDADVLVGWCKAPFGGVAGQVHPLLTGFTDANGNVTFQFFGGACLDPADFFGATYIAQVRADGLVMAEPFINSPDVVNSLGKKATDTPPTGGQRRCDLLNGVAAAQVSLSDAVFHTRPIKLGLREACTKFTPPFNGSIGVSDAVFLTPYIKTSSFCNCQ